MANVLKMTVIQSILSLHAQGWSHRRIAKTLAINRRTVSRYVRQQQAADRSKCTSAPIEPGRLDVDSKCTTAPSGSLVAAESAPSDLCFRAARATQLNQSLRALAGVYSGQARRKDSPPCAFIKTCAASRGPRRSATTACGGSEAVGSPAAAAVSADGVRAGSGSADRLRSRRTDHYPDGKRRKTHVLRVVLSHSRKGYSEACYRQTAEDFLRVLENAFWHFGGVPKTLVVDNLKAAVLRADWFDPELNPKLQSFAEHYGTVILPTRPRTPRHKGKVERGVAYVQDNGLKGAVFSSLEEQNRHLLGWEAAVADTRIHGTTKQQVGKVFVEVERAALLPLPAERLPFFHEAQRIVSRDGHIEVAKAYYSVRPEYLGRTVWVRWDARLVRIFNQQAVPIDGMKKLEIPRRFCGVS